MISNPVRDSTAERLLAGISKLPVVDTHEHMYTEADFVAATLDFGCIIAYTGFDLGLVSMSPNPRELNLWLMGEGSNALEKWRKIEPYWPRVRNTRFAICTRRALKRFFGFDDLNEQVCVEISDRIKDYQYKGVYREILQQEYGIRVSLRVQGDGGEPHYFAPVCYLDWIAGAVNRDELEIEISEGAPPNFDDYLAKLDLYLEQARADGAVALKIGWPTWYRPIDFTEEHTRADIEHAYRFLLANRKTWREPGVVDELRPFHDASFCYCFDWAGRNSIPVQIHSGLEINQSWDGRPSALIPCLTRYPETQFALFHGSYPYMDELTGLARSFQNVAMDLAWLPLLSGPLMEVWLDEWLEVLPPSKLMLFGGDCLTFFEVCSHLDMTRELLASVLAKRIHRGCCSEDEALVVAGSLLHDNPWEYYRLEERWKGRASK